jgi:histidyl-tRNA synthetase
VAASPEGQAALDPLRGVTAALEAMGLGEFVDVDLTIVRGIAYYTGTVFELFDAKRTLRAICGGGRYDNLLSAMGGADLPAVGFGMGDVVLGELLKDRGLAPAAVSAIQVFVAGVSPEDVPHVLRTAHQLREAGLAVEFALAGQGLGKQLNLADARGARLAVVIGPDDRAKGEVILRDLAAKSQRPVRQEALVEEARKQLGNE